MKYTIKACVKTKTNIGEFNLTEYAMTLVDSDGKEVSCTILQKADTPAPSGEIEGNIKIDPKWGAKFQKAKGNFGFKGGATESPRAHAQEMALRYCSIQVQLGALKSLSKESLTPIIEWFDKDATGESNAVTNSPSTTITAEEIQEEPQGVNEIDIDEVFA